MPSAQLPLARILRGEPIAKAQPEDYWLTTSAQRLICVSASGTPIYDDHGALTHAILVLRDVTETRFNQYKREILGLIHPTVKV